MYGYILAVPMRATGKPEFPSLERPNDCPLYPTKANRQDLTISLLPLQPEDT